MRELFKVALADDRITIQVQALKGESAPAALILLPEQMRRLNDMGALMEQRLPGLPDHHVLLVNRRHNLVEGLLRLSAGSVITGTAGSSPSPARIRSICSAVGRSVRGVLATMIEPPVASGLPA